MNKYKKLASDTALFIVSNLASKLLVFLMLPFYTNILSTEEYAVADLITTTLNIFFPILTLSVSEAMLRFAFDKDVKKNEIMTIGLSFVIGSTILLSPLASIVGKINETLSQYWGFFIASYFMTAMQTCISNYTRGCDKTRVFAVQGIVHAIVLVGCNLLFLLVFHFQLSGYLLSIILANVASVSYMIIKGHFLSDIIHPRWNIQLLRSMLKYSIPMVPTIIAWWVMQTSDKYIIIAELGLEQSGIYSVAYKIPSIMSIVTSLVAQAWQISAIQNYDERDNSEFVSNVYNLYNTVNLIACGILILLTKPLSQILYAKDFYIAWVCVPVLLLAHVFNGLSGMLASVFTASKKTKYLLVSTGFGAIVNIVLNLIIVKQHGILGAAVTTLVGFFVTWIIRYVTAQRILRFSTKIWLHILGYIILAIEAIIICMVEQNEMLVASIPLLILIALNYNTLRKIVISVLSKYFNKGEAEK